MYFHSEMAEWLFFVSTCYNIVLAAAFVMANNVTIEDKSLILDVKENNVVPTSLLQQKIHKSDAQLGIPFYSLQAMKNPTVLNSVTSALSRINMKKREIPLVNENFELTLGNDKINKESNIKNKGSESEMPNTFENGSGETPYDADDGKWKSTKTVSVHDPDKTTVQLFPDVINNLKNYSTETAEFKESKDEDNAVSTESLNITKFNALLTTRNENEIQTENNLISEINVSEVVTKTLPIHTTLTTMPTASKTENETLNQDNLSLCYAIACNISEKHIHILPSKTVVPIGSNTTFKCWISSNITDRTILYWYLANKNESAGIITTNSSYLNLKLQKVLLSDSGIYKCVVHTTNHCCHLEAHLTVYEVPPYKKHLLIVGAVAALSLLLCIPANAWNYKNMKKKTKILSQKKKDEQQLLLK